MPESTTRMRDLPFSKLAKSTSIQIVPGFPPQIDENVSGVTGRQTTTSENHPTYYRETRRRRKRQYQMSHIGWKYKGGDLGGPFHTVKHEYWASHPEVHLTATKGSSRYEFWGPLAPQFHSVGPTAFVWPTVPPYDENNLRAAGATAIALCSPLSPQVSVSQMLGELKNDGIPLLPSQTLLRAILRKERIISSIGGEFLNYMFGWKPTIADLRKLARVIDDSSKIIAQLRRDSGRPIRRRFDFPTVTTKSETITGSGSTLSTAPVLNNAFWSSMSGYRTKTVETETRLWFTGCFSYLLDPGDNALERARYHARVANLLFGVGITPETVWELLPWSWAADWFTNIGDVIRNLSNWAASGQTLRWGYMMRTERITHTYTLTGPTLKSGPSGPFIQKFTTIDKRRIKASPYGFQLEWGGFTNTQKAILAALGISRSGL